MKLSVADETGARYRRSQRF
jgi:hypothetical protein